MTASQIPTWYTGTCGSTGTTGTKCATVAGLSAVVFFLQPCTDVHRRGQWRSAASPWRHFRFPHPQPGKLPDFFSQHLHKPPTVTYRLATIGVPVDYGGMGHGPKNLLNKTGPAWPKVRRAGPGLKFIEPGRKLLAH